MRSTIVALVFLLGTVLIVSGCRNLLYRQRAVDNPHPTIKHTVITYSTDTPDETKPVDACAGYKAARTHPKSISLPTIHAGGCLEQVGIDQHGNVGAPDNIYTAAWYVKSVLPGQPGLSIIDGHLNGRYKSDGIFEHLHVLKVGDQFTVTRGDGNVLKYKVYNAQSVSLDRAAAVLFTHDDSIVSQLNLITCGGAYNKAARLYDHRTIISAALQ